MKRLLLTFFLGCASLLAFEFNADAWGDYLRFAPEEREALLSYPVSWLQPGTVLFDHDYQDSSSTYGYWEQIFAVDESNGYYPGMSNHIIAKYIPYSYPGRWSAGLEFINYKGGNSTYRTDAVLHYAGSKGDVEYFHTSNTQKIKLTTMPTEHKIKTHGLNFNYALSEKLKLNGGININLIDQSDVSETRNYNIHHEQIALNYSFLRSLSMYGTFHYWYYNNVDQEGPAWLFFPGIRYNTDLFKAHASLRVAKTTVHPIVELSLQPGPFYLNLFTKARSSRLDLQQAANQYYGLGSGLNINAKHHLLQFNAAYTYDVVRTTQADSIMNNDFQNLRIDGEYRFKTRNIDIYTKAYYLNTPNAREGYYHPVRSIITGGIDFRSMMANGHLKLSGGLNAQYILHDDPDKVSFDPSTLVYTLNGPADLLGDWKFNANLKAIIKTFSISAEISLPLESSDNLYYFFNNGIYTSSDFYIGNAMYMGLSIEWLWWK